MAERARNSGNNGPLGETAYTNLKGAEIADRFPTELNAFYGD